MKRLLAVLDVIVGAAAIGGAMFAIPTLPERGIEDTIFRTYLVPGLALALLVGAPFVNAGLMLGRDHELAAPASILAGLCLVIFQVVEGLTIGVESMLQPLMFAIGSGIALASFILWWRETAPYDNDEEWLGGHPNVRIHLR